MCNVCNRDWFLFSFFMLKQQIKIALTMKDSNIYFNREVNFTKMTSQFNQFVQKLTFKQRKIDSSKKVKNKGVNFSLVLSMWSKYQDTLTT
jgi:hypothetical protein